MLYPDGGRKMVDGICAINEISNEGFVANVTVDRFEAVGVKMREVRRTSRRKVVKGYDLPASLCEDVINEVGADEPCPAGDQNGHQSE